MKSKSIQRSKFAFFYIMTLEIIALLCLVAFIAGFVDSIVGGGGLIQTPLSLTFLPQIPVATVVGSLKIPAFSGTAIALTQYIKKVKVYWKLFALMAVLAFISAYIGSYFLTIVSNDFMKPLLLVILIGMGIFTFLKKDFGMATAKSINKRKLIFFAILISIVVGLYDGFIGPGTGTFFMVCFVSFLKMDFLSANTHAKLVNLSTNFGSICLFLIKGKVIWAIAIPMAIANGLGGYVGSKFALKKGNKIVRKFLIFVIFLSILRFAFDIYKDF